MFCRCLKIDYSLQNKCNIKVFEFEVFVGICFWHHFVGHIRWLNKHHGCDIIRKIPVYISSLGLSTFLSSGHETVCMRGVRKRSLTCDRDVWHDKKKMFKTPPAELQVVFTFFTRQQRRWVCVFCNTHCCKSPFIFGQKHFQLHIQLATSHTALEGYNTVGCVSCFPSLHASFKSFYLSFPDLKG